MKAIEMKPDIQLDLYCPTCRRQTKQAMLEGLLFSCIVCCENHTLEENTRQTDIALRQLQEASRTISQ